MSKVIHQINDIFAGIATAVEEQSAAASDIPTVSPARASNGIQEVNEASSELSESGTQIQNRAENLITLSHQPSYIIFYFKALTNIL